MLPPLYLGSYIFKVNDVWMENIVRSGWKSCGETTNLIYLLGSSLLTQLCIEWCLDQ